MAEPIRLLHFADLHIGVESYGGLDSATGINSRVLDFLARLDEVIAYAEAHDADLVICAGDIFQTRTPTPTYQREFARRVQKLASMCPVVLLVGNHDQPVMLKKATSIEIYSTLDVPNVVVGKRYDVQRIETKRGPVQVATAPYPNKARLLEDQDTGGISIAELDALLQEQVSLVIEEMAQQAAESDAPRVLAGHFTVSGATLGSERQIMLGRDAAVTPATLSSPVWDYVALGHIHKHQNLTEGHPDAPPVVYAGSLERVDFGEEGDPKGFCWVELARGATTWEFVEVNARPFKTVRVDVRESVDPTADIIAAIERSDLRDKVIRLILKSTPANEPLLRERDIRAAMRAAGVHHVASIQKQVERPTRGRWDGATPETLTPIELLEQYLIVKETPEDRRRELLTHAEKLFNLEE